MARKTIVMTASLPINALLGTFDVLISRNPICESIALHMFSLNDNEIVSSLQCVKVLFIFSE